jgi:hypothetical protein
MPGGPAQAWTSTVFRPAVTVGSWAAILRASPREGTLKMKIPLIVVILSSIGPAATMTPSAASFRMLAKCSPMTRWRFSADIGPRPGSGRRNATKYGSGAPAAKGSEAREHTAVNAGSAAAQR